MQSFLKTKREPALAAWARPKQDTADSLEGKVKSKTVRSCILQAVCGLVMLVISSLSDVRFGWSYRSVPTLKAITLRTSESLRGSPTPGLCHILGIRIAQGLVGVSFACSTCTPLAPSR
jgi:hypothetical protein